MDLTTSRTAPPQFDLGRRIGLTKEMQIDNCTSKHAWVIVSPSRMKTVSGIKISKLSIDFGELGECKNQKIPIAPYGSVSLELDSSSIYVTIFLLVEGKWKIARIDKKINARKYNLNILPKHVESAINNDSIPSL